MADKFSKQKRSQIMSRVPSSETKPEIIIRKLLFSKGFRYRKNVKSLPGKPDIVLPKYKTVIFVHGCFWHQHEGCRKSNRPTSNVEFWNKKLDRNMERDADNMRLLNETGWNIITIWECEIRNLENLAETLLNTITDKNTECL